MAFLPDGSQLLTCGELGGGLRFWHSRSGQYLGSWAGHPSMSGFVCNHRRMVTVAPGEARLWDVSELDQGRYEFLPLASYELESETVALSDRHLVLHLAERVVAVASSRSGRVKYRFPGCWFHLSSQSRRLVVGDGQQCRLVSAASGREILDPGGAGGLAAFSPEDLFLAMAGPEDTSIALLDTQGGNRFRLDAHAHPLRQLSFSPDGQQLASLCEEGVLNVLHLFTGHSLSSRLVGARSQLLQWLSPCRLAVADGTGALQLVTVRPDQLRSVSLPADGRAPLLLGRWCGGPEGLAAWAPAEGGVDVFDLGTAQVLARLPAARRPAQQPRLVCSGSLVLNRGQAWDFRKGQALAPLQYRVIDDQLISQGAERDCLHRPDGSVVLEYQAPGPDFALSAICPRGELFAFFRNKLDGPGGLMVLRRRGDGLEEYRTAPSDWRSDGEYIHTLYGGYPPGFAFSPCGRLLAIYAAEETPRVWLLESNRRVTLPGSPHFLPAGGWVNSTDEGRLQWWDCEGQLLRESELCPGLKGWRNCIGGDVVLWFEDRVERWSPELKEKLGQQLLEDPWAVVVTRDGKWLCVIHYHEDREDCTQVSLWSLPALLAQGPAQVFDRNDLRYLRVQDEHGWLLVAGSRRPGGWHLESGTFHRFPSGSYHALPGGKVLLFTEDGHWHLYTGSPPRQVATLQSCADGGSVVLGADGSWDASPSWIDRVNLPGRPCPGLWTQALDSGVMGLEGGDGQTEE